MLSVEHLSKYYGNKIGVKDLSFRIGKGKVMGILGSNGSGKTTTFRMLLGLIEKSEGKILYEGKELNFSDKCLFGYLPEEKSLLRDLKVKDQVFYLARLKKMDDQIIEQQLDYWLEYFQIERYKNAKVATLSKGNMQLIQIICALVHQPEIIIFDEPLNGLDLENVAMFKKLCQKLKKEGKILLVSSHQYNNIEDLVDEVVYLDKGKTCFKGNLKMLKKKHPERIIIIDREEGYEEDKGIIDVEYIGNKTLLKVENEETAKSYIRKFMKEKSTFSLELISLQMMIKETLNERAD